MMVLEALTLLGLSWSDRNCTQAITRAWKLKLLCAHPDKNSSCYAVQQTQQLNQAKEELLAQREYNYLNLQEQEGMPTKLERAKKQHEELNEVLERMKRGMQASKEQHEQREALRGRQFVEMANKGREAVLEQRARNRKRRAED
jgi:hypothetical protein